MQNLCLAPAAMKPEPLPGMPAHPVLYGLVDLDHEIADVGFGVVGPADLEGGLDDEAEARAADALHEGAMDWTAEAPRELGQRRCGLRRPAEEGDRQAEPVMLVHQHAQMLALLQRFGGR